MRTCDNNCEHCTDFSCECNDRFDLDYMYQRLEEEQEWNEILDELHKTMEAELCTEI